MSECIDRAAAFMKLMQDGCSAKNLQSISDMPAADVAEVVRCKGCKHSTLPSELTQRYGVPGTRTCHNRYSPCNRRNVGEEDFCSYGERRGGGDDNVSD